MVGILVSRRGGSLARNAARANFTSVTIEVNKIGESLGLRSEREIYGRSEILRSVTKVLSLRTQHLLASFRKIVFPRYLHIDRSDHWFRLSSAGSDSLKTQGLPGLFRQFPVLALCLRRRVA